MRPSDGRVQARRPGQLDRQAGGAAGLILAGGLLELVQAGRVIGRNPVIGDAGWSWQAVGRLGRIANGDDAGRREQMQVRCSWGCRLARAEAGHKRE